MKSPCFHLLILFSSALLLLASCKKPQYRLEHLNQPNKIHIRALDFHSAEVIWAAGTKGTVIKSLDGGQSWSDFQIPNCEKLDFRDIEAFSKDRVMILSASSPARIYETKDGGLSWELLYENTDSLIFFDGMDFDKNGFGMAYGDPINGQFANLIYQNGLWDTVTLSLPDPLQGEAGFAASGTGIICEDGWIWFATGSSKKPRIFRAKQEELHFKAQTIPMVGGEAKGIYSIAKNGTNMVAVGGSYIDSMSVKEVAAISKNSGATWAKSLRPPFGYRSCVVAVPKDGPLTFVSCGRTGIDFTRDAGISWEMLATVGYYTASVNGSVVLFAGRNGKMAKLDLSVK